MSGLPHIQQLAYLRGIRPYMDVKTGITGIKRRISYQSIAEQLYIEPHQGIKSQSFSRDQVRRAISGLTRAGLIEVQSEGKQLILKCPLASRHFSVQNKAAINPPQKATIKPHEKNLVNTGFSEKECTKADTVEPPKAATPLKDNNYIYLLSAFEQFWNLYPEKNPASVLLRPSSKSILTSICYARCCKHYKTKSKHEMQKKRTADGYHPGNIQPTGWPKNAGKMKSISI